MTEEPPPMSDIRGGLFCDEPVCHPRADPSRHACARKAHTPACFTGKAQGPCVISEDGQ